MAHDAAPTLPHAFRLGDTLHELWLSRTPQGATLHRGARRLPVALRDLGAGVQQLQVDGRSLPVVLAVQGDTLHVHLDGEAYTLRYVPALDRFASGTTGASEAVTRAPMPGAVIAVDVQGGQRVRRGDRLLVIESMKMETTLAAGVDGVVHTLHVGLGQSFDRDALLVTLQPDDDGAEAPPRMEGGA